MIERAEPLQLERRSVVPAGITCKYGSGRRLFGVEQAIHDEVERVVPLEAERAA